MKEKYESACLNVKQLLSGCKTSTDKVRTIDLVMDMIRNDLESSILTHALYGGRFPNENLFLLPLTCYSEKGETISLYQGKEVFVALNQSCIISHLDSLWGLWCSAIGLNYDPYTEKDYEAWYYPEIDVCYVANGRQKVIAKRWHRTITIKAKEISLMKAFSSLYTDGEYWLNAHTGETLMKVHDFRIAILYKLAKMSNSIKSDKK